MRNTVPTVGKKSKMTSTVSRRAPVEAAAPNRSGPARRNRVPSVARNLWWFVLPALALYAFIVILPTIQGVGASFTNWSAFNRDAEFVGFDNYILLFQGDLGAAAFRTFLLAIVTMVIMNILGLFLALLLNGAIKGRNILRTLIFAPVVISSLVVAYLFKYIFGPPNIGAANALLKGFGLSQVDWLGQPTTAFIIIAVAVCWQFTGMAMVIYLAGLQGVPAELLEAAAIDGAGSVKRFWHVIRPLLAPAFTINLMLGLIGGLKIFDQVWAMTRGGPANSTQTISSFIYQQFSVLGLWSNAVTLAVILAIGVAVLSLIQFAVLRRQEKLL
jgi:raffinose/stachyose/melibiose transport system permease protein